MYSYKCFNYTYMEFVGYETCEISIWTSGEGYINTNTNSKQVIKKVNMNKTYPSSTFGFGCNPHKDTCEILS